MSTKTRTLVHEMVEAWNSHDLNHTHAYLALDYSGEDVAQAAPHTGREGMRAMLTLYWTAFPDLVLTTDRLLVDGHQAALFWTACGVHQGAIMRIPATGRVVQVRGASLITVNSGLIRQASHIWDVAGMLRNVGLLPALRVHYAES